MQRSALSPGKATEDFDGEFDFEGLPWACCEDATDFNVGATKKETICDPAKELDRPLLKPGSSPQMVGVSRCIPILSITRSLTTA